jgi:hypothetical protein
MNKEKKYGKIRLIAGIIILIIIIIAYYQSFELFVKQISK